jgi:hypothetical protein
VSQVGEQAVKGLDKDCLETRVGFANVSTKKTIAAIPAKVVALTPVCIVRTTPWSAASQHSDVIA